MEVAGVSLAVLPIIFAAVKGYGAVADSFRTFKNLPREVRLIETQFLTHKTIFENECRLLLCLVVDDGSLPEDMISNFQHESWKSNDLDQKLYARLDTQLRVCKFSIDAIAMAIEDFAAEVEGLRDLTTKWKKGETLRQTVHRLRKTLSVTFDKQKYEKAIERLGENTKNFASLRRQLFEFKSLGDQQSKAVARKLPRNFSDIRTASQNLQSVLRTAWWCGSEQHQRHIAKLSIEAEAGESVRLDLAITCQQSCQLSESSGRCVEPPIWLYVQNVTLMTQETDHGAVVTSLERTQQIACVLEPGRGDEKNRAKKKQRVKFCDDVTTSQGINSIPPALPMINLYRHRNLCNLFKSSQHAASSTLRKDDCIGYLESSNQYRHMFFLADCHPNLQSHKSKSLEILALPTLMTRSDGGAASVVDQYKLAHKAALAVLQYHSTPWMGREWHLQDLALFQDCVETLHLSAEIPDAARTKTVVEDVAMETADQSCVQTTQASVERKYGVNNMTLLCLGMVLLQIAYWKPFEKLRIDEDGRIDVLTARRLVERESRLGERYQEIVRKCLQCDFGVGNDLNKQVLQNAVYGHVVCELEQMIASLQL